MKDWLEGDTTTNGIKIHYYRTGGDKPPVVINHGAGDDGLCWTRVAKALEKDYVGNHSNIALLYNSR